MKKLLILAAGAPAWKPPFIESLNRYGIKPLGIVEISQKSPEFNNRFTDIFGLGSLADSEKVVQAAKWLFQNIGFEIVECFEEYWKSLEAEIREELGLKGRTRAELKRNSSKAFMKEVFQKAGVRVASSFSASSLQDCLQKAQGKRFPLFAKPDEGVGAQNTFRINSADDFRKLLERGQEDRFSERFIIEDFLAGKIVTFDGLIDFDGRIINCFHLIYPDVANVVSGKTDQCVFIDKTCPEEVFEFGRKIVDSFGLQGEFFHIEFKKESDGLYGMDANTRLCGACSPWMYGTTVIDSITDRWARMMAGEMLEPKLVLDRLGGMICRRGKEDFHFKPYRYSHEEVLNFLGEKLLYVKAFEPCFRDNLNSYAFFVKGQSMDDLKSMRDYIHELAA